MRRLKKHSDRGASIVLVAISMAVLIGFTALAVDVGAMWSDKKQLQNGADAGALALAQICANAMDEPTNCNNNSTFRDDLLPTAESYAAGNKIGGSDAGKVDEITWDLTQSRVTVVTERTEDVRGLFFAPVLGVDEANVKASATATWGVKSGGQFLPLTFNLCAFAASAGSPTAPPTPGAEKLITLYLKSDPAGGSTPKATATATATPTSSSTPTSSAAPMACPSPVGATNGIPGGFGWLDTPSGSTDECLATVSTGDLVASDPGGNQNCLDLEELKGPDQKGAIVEIPIFDKCVARDGTVSATDCSGGSGGTYSIYAMAAFHVKAFCLPTTSSVTGPAQWWAASDFVVTRDTQTVCNASVGEKGHRILGYFMGFADNGDGDSNSTPPPKNLGLGIVYLVD